MKPINCEGLESTWHLCYYFKWPISDYVSRQLMDGKADDNYPINITLTTMSI
jgi:hypothetical protein